MIDPDALARQRDRVNALRLEAEKLEAEARVKAAREEAVRLGLRKWCAEGCGRVVGLQSKTLICPSCQKVKCMRRLRAGKRGEATC